MSEVNAQWESNRLCFYTSERNKTSLKQKVKKAFALEYKIAETEILDVKLEPGGKKIILRTKIEDRQKSRPNFAKRKQRSKWKIPPQTPPFPFAASKFKNKSVEVLANPFPKK